VKIQNEKIPSNRTGTQDLLGTALVEVLVRAKISRVRVDTLHPSVEELVGAKSQVSLGGGEQSVMVTY
jgi:hypothetical protein